ncbi:hypothetical protein DY000_02042891 [Brassica cretica]|uniref:RNase H type-1 domain-containing protein n=1 Tax=Brassica cretica TaxID=69181 RepID=A0ABQ7BCC6_BRACR|nr:hypothetical protein DY000_02042891 [Brassica cretica]
MNRVRYGLWEIASKRPSGTDARSLRSDRAGRALGHYVATELWLELGRYVATERDGCSVATKARSLRSD